MKGQAGTDKLQQQRLHKLELLGRMGLDPYGGRFDGVQLAQYIRSRPSLEALENEGTIEGPEGRARCAGRIILLRDIGRLIFITLRDSTGSIQVGLSKKALADRWEHAKLLEVGDLIGCDGQLGKTRTGEITVWADSVTVLGKSLMPPPEKFHGLQSTELRYRHRYVDLWANPEVMQLFKNRSGIIASLRQFLHERGFLEVETPMMQSQVGGAAARPFVTHHNSLGMDLYLRIAPELFLKRLLVGGMEKVFEINRNFRNEGLSRRHNPEFTMLELYQAYADYEVMMDLTEEIICLLVERHCSGGGTKVSYGDCELDFSRPWRRVTYAQLLKEAAGCDIDDAEAMRTKAAELSIENAPSMDSVVLADAIMEAAATDRLYNPTFVVDYPAQLCPLTKTSRQRPGCAERFELFVAGMELANAYTELNDPVAQENNFRIQLGGQIETMAKMDDDFLTALKYGMPSAGGLGIGIDRLVMILTGAANIRDVILFPLLKPPEKNGG